MENIIVCKFGGSSLSSSEGVQAIIDILAQPQRNYIAVSAIGRRYNSDIKVTDLLIELHRCILNADTVGINRLWKDISARYLSVFGAFVHKNRIKRLLKRTYIIVLEMRDYAFTVSRGEFLSAKLLAIATDYPFVDAACIINVRNQKLCVEASINNIQKAIRKLPKFITGGFYGREIDIDVISSAHFNRESKEYHKKKALMRINAHSKHNKICRKVGLLSRGGSDITGAILAVGANAKLYENFTDVNGVMTADPKKVGSFKPIRRISYDDIFRMGFFGASVFHPDSVHILQTSNIPIAIRNTYNNWDFGTIVCGYAKKPPFVTCTDCAVVYVKGNVQLPSYDSILRIVSDCNGFCAVFSDAEQARSYVNSLAEQKSEAIALSGLEKVEGVSVVCNLSYLEVSTDATRKGGLMPAIESFPTEMLHLCRFSDTMFLIAPKSQENAILNAIVSVL
ncbi:MAG: hypothetical protein PHX51_03500 [Clostridia bacterium]|nr:hypothetical protein [Clostridia bacterium]